MDLEKQEIADGQSEFLEYREDDVICKWRNDKMT